MTLARHEDALRADLQQTYGIDLDAAMCGGHTAPHVAALVHQLPPDSRLGIIDNADNAWTRAEVLLAAIFNSMAAWQWAQLDKRKRGPMPKRVGPSYMREDGRKLDAQVMTIAQLMRELQRPRKEVG